MPNVDDHGLEVLKKAATNIDPTTKRNYALQVFPVDLFSVPQGATAFTVEYPTNTSEVYKYRTAYPSGTVLKTITIYYATPSKKDIIGGSVV